MIYIGKSDTVWYCDLDMRIRNNGRINCRQFNVDAAYQYDMINKHGQASIDQKYDCYRFLMIGSLHFVCDQSINIMIHV